jgi:hypothetical protein
MIENDSDISLILCDDDALAPDSLKNLNSYYQENPDVMYSYGHVSVYNPEEVKDYASLHIDTDHWLNRHYYPINPYCQVDASQVSWRSKPALARGLWFPSPQTSALDAEWYKKLFDEFGACQYNGVITQYKGIFPDQMGSRTDMFTPRDRGPYGV